MKNKDSAFAPILLVCVFILLGSGSWLLSSGAVGEKQLGLSENPYLAAVVLQLLIYALPALFYCRIRGSEFRYKLRLKLPPFSQCLFILYAAVLLIGSSALISVGMYTLSPESFAAGSVDTYTAFARNAGVFDGLYLVLAFAVLPAVTEEFLFRGIMAASYEKFGVSLAVVVSALTLAMSHFSFSRFPVYFVSGLILALVMYATRSLPAAMLVHGLNNIFVLFLESYVLHIADKQSISMILFIIIVSFFTLLAAVLLCFEAGNIYSGYAKQNVPSTHAVKRKGGLFKALAESVFAPGFLVAVVLFVLITVFITGA